MVAHSIELVLAYLLFGLVACFLARKGRPDDWDETLLASVLGPPLFIALALALAAGLLWERRQRTMTGHPANRSSAGAGC
jgi:hypothetical protein